MSIDLDHPFLPLLTQRTSTSREFLRELHRGLETGTKRGIESIKGILGETEEDRFANAIMVLNILKKDRKLFPWDSPEAYNEKEKQHLESWRKKFLQELEPGKKTDTVEEQHRKVRLANDLKMMFPWDSTEPKSYAEIQRDLESPVINAKGQVLIRKPLIRTMSPQGFHKMIKRLWALAENQRI